MQRAWLLWALLSYATLASTAHAQEELPALPHLDLAQPCAPEVLDDRRRALLSHGADTGIWFHGAVARCMLARLALLPLYVDRVRLLEQRIAVHLSVADHLTEAELLSRQIADQAGGALEAAERGRRQAEEDRDAWYRSPALWAGIGGVVVAAVAVAVRYAISPW